jgi:hypothetical protein
MAKRNAQETGQATNSFQFTLAGLAIFSMALIGATALVTARFPNLHRPAQAAEGMVRDTRDNSRATHTGPWGTLLTRDIQLERPTEYLTDDVITPKPQVWTFAGLTPEAVKTIFSKNGLNAGQVTEAFAPDAFTQDAAGTELTPSRDFLVSLTPEQRQKLYTSLAGLGVNLYIDYPYIFPAEEIQSVYADARLDPDDVSLLKQLVYPNGTAQQLSDYPFLLEQIPTVERRTAITRALSRQSAVLARLVVQPDTDIDKIAGYWGQMPGVRFNDIRPLLESLKQLPEGGAISLLYLLPKFARERLYTFPLPSQPGEPVMDCHWSTFNFCNDKPDNRFNDPAFAVDYIRKNFYQIATPSVYGDIVLLMNDKQEVKHSAVYIADDIVFTKNGNNYRQPWMLMRIPDLLATYPSLPPMKVIYMRRKTN